MNFPTLKIFNNKIVPLRIKVKESQETCKQLRWPLLLWMRTTEKRTAMDWIGACLLKCISGSMEKLNQRENGADGVGFLS